MSADSNQPTGPKGRGLLSGPDTDPEATISGPLARADDPDATISGPLTRVDDPDATVSIPPAPAAEAGAPVSATMASLMKMGDVDPEDTLKPQPRVDDPEATFNGIFADFDPDATLSGPSAARRRANPFAPKALPEALQANLAALGGLNPLIAFANPILSAVPQIRAAQDHPAPALLMETLEDLIEAFEAGATNAGTPDAILEASIYTLCCMADDAAASTAWGSTWEKEGLLQKLRGESTGGEEFFSLLAEVSQQPQANADLLELMYVCLSLGFAGRYRGADGGQPELERIRADLHALVTRNRPPPAGGLSARWQAAKPGAVPKKATPGRAPAAAFPWRVAAAAVAGLVLFAAYRGLDKPSPALVPAPVAAGTPTAAQEPPAQSQQPSQPQPLPQSLHKRLEQALAADVQGGRFALSEEAGRSVISLRNPGQFPSGHVEPAPEARASIEKLGLALEGVPGPILVRGYSDATPVHSTVYASNRELSAARAQAAAKVLAAKLSDPKRLASEGAAEADPVAPNDTDQNRAKNRRVVFILGPKP